MTVFPFAGLVCFFLFFCKPTGRSGVLNQSVVNSLVRLWFCTWTEYASYLFWCMCFYVFLNSANFCKETFIGLLKGETLLNVTFTVDAMSDFLQLSHRTAMGIAQSCADYFERFFHITKSVFDETVIAGAFRNFGAEVTSCFWWRKSGFLCVFVSFVIWHFYAFSERKKAFVGHLKSGWSF